MRRSRFTQKLIQTGLVGSLALACLPLGAAPLAARAADAASPVWQSTNYKEPWTHTLASSKDGANGPLDLSLRLADSGKPIQFIFTSGKDAEGKPINLFKVAVSKDKEGRMLTTGDSPFVDGKWERGRRAGLVYWPVERNKKDSTRVVEDGLEPRSWQGKDIPVRIENQAGQLRVIFQGQIIGIADITGVTSPIELQVIADTGDTITTLTQQSASKDSWRYYTVDLAPSTNEKTKAPIQLNKTQLIPYELANKGNALLDLKNADWVDGKRNPSSYYERYDSGQYFLGDDRQPMIQIPQADYTAAYVLAAADTNPETSNILTLRAGRYNTAIRGQVVRYDFPVEIPRSDKGDDALKLIRVPMPVAFAQDILDGIIDVELTKEIRLARRTPDPNRFRWRAQGLPSSVRIAAITFERSPLQMKVTSKESGHLFVEPQQPTFTISLTNISPDKQAFTLKADATYVDGSLTTAQTKGSVDAGKTSEVTLPVPASTRGYYNINIQLLDAQGNALLQRETSFAILPDAKRPHHNDSPVGVWDFCGGHLTPNDPDFTGPIYQKLGLRYGMFSYPLEKRQQYGVVKGNEFSVRSNTKLEDVMTKYDKMLEQYPDLLPNMLIFHEDSISGRHVTRAPDLFTGREEFKFDENEQKRWDTMYNLAVDSAKLMRARDPKVIINIGNGPLPLREEFLRRGFPKELFDNAGNEAGVFGRPPEAQPPDIVTNNASVWMDRMLLDHYGYKDKGIAQCYEIDYPSTNPGNLSVNTQAAYFARHILHGMSWGMPQIRVGSITDMGNSYYFSNWGSSGIMRKWPEVNPKPAAVYLGTLTWVMDGATFNKKVDLGSDSLYGLLFDRKDGKRVLAVWTIRGVRPLTLTFENLYKEGTTVTNINSQAVETPLKLDNGKVTITITGAPSYLLIQGDPTITGAEPGTPAYTAAPTGKSSVVAPLDSLDSWTVSDKRNAELEVYNPFDPRRKGDFKYEVVKSFEGKDNVIKVTPESADNGIVTVAMYSELMANKPINLPGKPSEIGMWVNGNSSWGRIIFRFEDAKGQKWVSIGAAGKSGNPWLADWLPADMLEGYDPGQNADWNTNDVFGLSRINFDGWRYIGIALPGQYDGAGNYPWPANSQWRFDKDGIVAYPIKLTAVVVQLPEKTLLVKDFQPVRRAEIYLSDIIVSEDNSNRIKKSIPEYDDTVQTNGL